MEQLDESASELRDLPRVDKRVRQVVHPHQKVHPSAVEKHHISFSVFPWGNSSFIAQFFSSFPMCSKDKNVGSRDSFSPLRASFSSLSLFLHRIRPCVSGIQVQEAQFNFYLAGTKVTEKHRNLTPTQTQPNIECAIFLRKKVRLSLEWIRYTKPQALSVRSLDPHNHRAKENDSSADGFIWLIAKHTKCINFCWCTLPLGSKKEPKNCRLRRNKTFTRKSCRSHAT